MSLWCLSCIKESSKSSVFCTLSAWQLCSTKSWQLFPPPFSLLWMGSHSRDIWILTFRRRLQMASLELQVPRFHTKQSMLYCLVYSKAPNAMNLNLKAFSCTVREHYTQNISDKSTLISNYAFYLRISKCFLKGEPICLAQCYIWDKPDTDGLRMTFSRVTK